MRKFCVLVVSAACLEACTPKLSDPAEHSRPMRAEWDVAADCVYADLLTHQNQSAGHVTTGRNAAQKTAIIGITNASGESTAVITIRGLPEGGSIAEARYSLLGPTQGYDLMSEAALSNCAR